MSNYIEKREELLNELMDQTRAFIARAILFNQIIADEFQIKTIDLQCINIIELLKDDATPGKIAKMFKLTTGGATVMLDRLEKKGFIERIPNPNDRRSSIIRISKEISELHAKYDSKANELNKAFSTYNNEELSLILDYYKKVVEYEKIIK